MAKMKNILIFIGNLDYSVKCDQIIEYSTDMHQKDTRVIPDEYIELINYCYKKLLLQIYKKCSV